MSQCNFPANCIVASEGEGEGEGDEGEGEEKKFPGMDELLSQFQSFGFNPGTLFSQISSALGNPASANSGSLVPLETIREIGRTYIAAQSQLPVGSVDLAQCTQALDIANLWLDEATIFPALTRNPSTAWSRKEWLDASTAGWQKLVEPLAQGMATALTSIVEQGEAAGDFDIEWANNPGNYEWQKIKLAEFKEWLVANNFDPDDKSLTIGHPQVAQVDLQASFGTTDYRYIWAQLNDHLDVYSIKTSSASAEYKYCWSDPDYIEQQILALQGH